MRDEIPGLPHYRTEYMAGAIDAQRLVSKDIKIRIGRDKPTCAISYGESALQVSEPLRKYRQSEGREKISKRDSVANHQSQYVAAQAGEFQRLA